MDTNNWKNRLIERDPTLHIHLIGIGGAGLNPIAQILHEMGIHVSGSDREEKSTTQQLASLGVSISVPQMASNLKATGTYPDVVLMSSAIGPENPERQAAEKAGVPTVKRDQFLPIMLQDRVLIAVAGTHGKSTTTSMIVKVLRDAGIEAGYLIGATMPTYGSASAGSPDCPLFVLEADEYDRMFLGLLPTVAVVTNIEWDHPDCYPTAASFHQAFEEFVERVDERGLIVSCADDRGADNLRRYYTGTTDWVTYGRNPQADLEMRNLTACRERGFQAGLWWWNAPAGELVLDVPGIHNMRNALAAIYVARWCDVPIPNAIESLATFEGTTRRFEIKGEVEGVTVIDDYAHHPTEVSATLEAAHGRYPNRRIWAVFQPHTYSRTKILLQEIGQSFDAADRVLVTDIYAAREQDNGSVNSAQIVAASNHPAIEHVPAIQGAAERLASSVQAGDVVITLGAGDSYQIGEILLECLRERQEKLIPAPQNGRRSGNNHGSAPYATGNGQINGRNGGHALNGSYGLGD